MSLDNEQQYLESSRLLTQALEAGDEETAKHLVDELTRLRETSLFKEIGSLTRELHESLKTFRLDTRINELTSTEIPDARERLNYVITMTEQAAHRTLTAIEESMPGVETITSKAHSLSEQWQRFRNRELSVDEFRHLSREVDEFLGTVESEGGKVQSQLTEALMAQDYQDLTGQIIRRVINLVQEVEENLVQLVRISGGRMVEEKRQAADKQEDEAMKLEGPHVPGTGSETQEFVQGQDDVDDLLSSLGF